MSDFEKNLQNILNQVVDTGDVAGVNLLVHQNGKELVYMQAGFADIDKKKPFDRNTIMRMYSMSKPITAAATMLLLQRGLITLGEPVSKYLPGFKNQMILDEKGKKKPVVRPAYIRDLLYMTSGLPYGNSEGTPSEIAAQKVFDRIDKKLYTKKALNTVEIANELAEAGISFQPGERWMYGTSADILGALVEVVTGERYGDFLKKEFFEPLGMVDTDFYVPEEKRERLAEVYEWRSGKLVHFPTNNLGIRYSCDEDPAFQSGGAGIISTVDDYSHFAQMLLDGGSYAGHQILNSEIVDFMAGSKLLPWQQESAWRCWDSMAGYGYGCLMRHLVDRHMTYNMTWPEEYGWDGWLGTQFVNIPGKNTSIICGMQISNPEGNFVFDRIRNTLGQYI